MATHFLPLSKKMCLAHLHPKANICAKFHENWWKTEEVVRDARFSPHFCHMLLPWQHSFCHCRKMCLAHLHPKAHICARFHENWSKTEEVVRDARFATDRPTTRWFLYTPLYTTCMRGYKYIYWVQMTLFHFVGVKVVWNCISKLCSFQLWYKNWGSPSILKSNFDFKNGRFLPIFSLLGNFTCAQFFSSFFLLLIASVWRHCKSEWTENLGIYSDMYQKSDPFEKTAFIRSVRAVRALTRAEIFELFEMTWFVLKIVQKEVLSNFKFWPRHDARANMDVSVCWPMTGSLCVLNLIQLWWMVMKIWIITWKLKMAPSWRHGWVITLKRSTDLFLIMAKML